MRKGKLPDNFPADQVLLDDAFQHFRRAGVIPDAFGINDCDWPAHADAQAVGLGAINQRLRAGEIQFPEPPFQKFPGGQSVLLRATFRLGLVGTKKNVAPEFFDAERFNGGLQLCFHKIRPRPRSSSSIGYFSRTRTTTKRKIMAHRQNVRPKTPATAMRPPVSDRAVIFSPSKTRASGSMTMGVMAMMAVTMPVGVFSSAHCMQLTPIVCPARLLTRTHGQSFNFSRAEKESIICASSPCRRACRHFTIRKTRPSATAPPMTRW